MLFYLFTAISLGNAFGAQNTTDTKPPVNTNHLEVQRYYILPNASGNVPNSIISFVWKYDKLWLGIEENRMPESTNRTVQTFDLKTMQEGGKKWATPIEKATQDDFARMYTSAETAIGQGFFFDVDSQYLYTIAATNKIFIYNLGSGLRRVMPMDLPPGRNKSLKKDGQDLLVITEDRILKVAPTSGEVQIITSKRRRPAVNLLDEVDWRSLPEVMIDPKGNKTVIAHRYPGSDVYQQEPSTGTWSKTGFFPSQVRNAILSHSCDGNLCVISVRTIATDIWLQTSTNSLPLFSSARPVSGRWGANAMKLDFFGSIGNPANLMNQSGGSRASWNDSMLWVLTKSGNRSIFTNPAYKIECRSPDADATLWLFAMRWQYPLEVPMKFKIQEKDSRYFSGFFEGIRNGFLPPIYAVPEGLVIMIPKEHSTSTYAGFWFIPKEEITDWCDSSWPVNKRLPSFYNARLSQFDENHNGFLDENESRAYNNSPAYRSDLAAQTAFEIIPKFDFNGDGILDGDEVWRGYRQELGRELTTRYMVPDLSSDDHKSLLEAADKNHDGNIDLGELTELLKTSKRPDFFPGFNLPPVNPFQNNLKSLPK